ncbi:MAG: hypothetical protein A2000_13720 [Ignavibacteria bacterium GWB2_36_8]|nr:MAG: hypothetical protein A2000_13720 [Ignavibacteria bacterium GWB2_36_8]OGU48843.1 MAG: hypothetical protein A2080_15555 [Ignavibacteria bacterium GWC2_36_12]
MNNKEWSEKILQKYDSLFKHRWEIYDEIVKGALSSQMVWVDCGCGNDGMVETYASLVKTAVGVDIIDPIHKRNYIKADIRYLPFPSDYADLITLRFVVEHFQNSGEYIYELTRAIKPGGQIIILTTNLLSPFIFLPRLFLPSSIKSKILTKLFKVKDEDVFPAYHKMNTPDKFKKLTKNFRLKKMMFISDLNYTRKWVFILLLIWHKITGMKILNKFRTNILAILEKK